MHRITITIDDELMSDLDDVIETRGYQNRSEAIRDLTRAGIQLAAKDAGKGRDCIAALVYVYDHSARDLARRLVHTFHDHHDMSLATLHVHLDHETCMELTVLKGRTVEVQKVADGVIAERGVRYGRLVVVPVELSSEVHAHASESPHRHSHAHVHRKP
jgi:CopG family transcriptional regulator, nickel-responsive regulator